MLFAKVIEFTQDSSSPSAEPVCKIRLGYQTPRGIIDVYLYLLSKFDRKRYELIKFLGPSAISKETAGGLIVAHVNAVPITPSPSSINTESQATTKTTTTYSLPSPPHSVLSSLDNDNECAPATSIDAHCHNGSHLQSQNINDEQSHFGSDNGDHDNEDDDEYDGDLLFSDLAGYFTRMKLAADG